MTVQTDKAYNAYLALREVSPLPDYDIASKSVGGTDDEYGEDNVAINAWLADCTYGEECGMASYGEDDATRAISESLECSAQAFRSAYLWHRFLSTECAEDVVAVDMALALWNAASEWAEDAEYADLMGEGSRGEDNY